MEKYDFLAAVVAAAVGLTASFLGKESLELTADQHHSGALHPVEADAVHGLKASRKTIFENIEELISQGVFFLPSSHFESFQLRTLKGSGGGAIPEMDPEMADILGLTKTDLREVNGLIQSLTIRIKELTEGNVTLLESTDEEQKFRISAIPIESASIRDDFKTRLVELLGQERADFVAEFAGTDFYHSPLIRGFGGLDTTIRISYSSARQSYRTRYTLEEPYSNQILEDSEVHSTDLPEWLTSFLAVEIGDSKE